ncbi:MAG: hypothetical protein V9F04_17110 [Dermatophilaceae bacterium]
MAISRELVATTTVGRRRAAGDSPASTASPAVTTRSAGAPAATCATSVALEPPLTRTVTAGWLASKAVASCCTGATADEATRTVTDARSPEPEPKPKPEPGAPGADVAGPQPATVSASAATAAPNAARTARVTFATLAAAH